MTEIDTAIVEEYKRFEGTADQILTDPALAETFWTLVNKRLRPDERLNAASGGPRLLYLRKKGEAKGGLARKHRSYRGRGPNKPR